MSNKSQIAVLNIDQKAFKQLDKTIQKINKLKSKTVTITLKIKDKISQPLSKIKKEINKLNNKKVTTIFKADDRVSKKLNIITNKLRKVKTRPINIAVDVKDKTSGAEKVANFAKGSITAAQAQAGNEIKLASTLKLRTKASKEQINSILKLTSVQQQNGVVSDEVQMAGAGQLAAYAGNTKNIQALIPAMNNLLVSQKGLNGTSDDAVEVANLMGQGLKGQTDGLKAAGLSFSQAQEKVLKYGTEEERAATLANVIADNVGNANDAMAGTDAGAIQQAQNLFKDLQEQIGARVLPYLAQFAKWFSENQPMIKGIVDSIAEGISSAAQKVYNFFQKVADFICKHQEAVLFLITFVGVLAGLIGIISLIASVITTITTVIGILTAAQSLFNLTLAGCPLVWIIVGIALIIAAIVTLFVYWDVFIQKAGELWISIQAAFAPLAEFFSGLWEGIKAGFKSFINFIIDGINAFTATLSWIPEKLSQVPGFGWAANFIIPQIPQFALGTQYFKGGFAHINERGGEIVDLPNGSRVIPADKSERMMNSGSVSFGNIYITAKGVTANEVANEIVPLLKLKLANI
nr:hypothetical protein [uncultured Aminipila sp.]